MIIDVQCEDETIQIARIVHETNDTYSVQFLEKNTRQMYDFSNTVEVIDKESVSGFYDTDDLEKTHLYVKTPNGYELIDDSEDEDYSASDTDSDASESDVSLVDEEE
jgi:hypothetical protein